MSSTTTSKPKRRGSKHGTTKATRRLQRELADKQALTVLIGVIRDVAVELEHVAVNNPIVGFALGTLIIAGAHKVRLLNDVEYSLILAGFGLLELSSAAGNVATALAGDLGAIAQFLPSVGSKSLTIDKQATLISGNATTVTEARNLPIQASTNAGGETSSTPSSKGVG